VKLSRLWKKKPSLHHYVPWKGTWEEAIKVNTAENKVFYGFDAMAEEDRKRRDEFLKRFSNEGSFIDGQSQQLLAALSIVLSKHHLKSLKVLDFGGSWGIFYHYLHRALPGITLDWMILETETMVKLFEPFAESHLRWQSTLPEAPSGPISPADKPFDICLASAALHHVEDPEVTVRRLAGLGRYLLINRIPLLDRDQDQIVFQRCSHSSQKDLNLPAWLFSGRKLVRLLKSLGTLRLDWDVPQDQATLEDRNIPFRGFLLETDPQG
jgi:putative methyltransferase (TIGR04325 family)